MVQTDQATARGAPDVGGSRLPPPCLDRLACALVGLLTLSACASERVVATDEAGTRSASLQMLRGDVTVVLTDGRRYRGRDFRATPEWATWGDPDTGRHGVPTREVATVERVSARNGAVRGAAIGAALAGTAVAILVCNAAQSRDCGCACGLSAGLSLGLSAGASAASLAAGAGYLIGGAVGDVETVHFAPSEPASQPFGAPIGGTLAPVPTLSRAPR